MSDDTSKAIADLTQEIMKKQEELNKLMRETQGGEVNDYVLQDLNGDVFLSELFGDKEDLVLIHNMGKSCPYCTLWADGLNGALDHFENRAAFVLLSPDSPEDQQAFAKSRNWNMRMLSSMGSSLSKDLGFETDRGVMPGFSTFHLAEDGKISRVAYACFGPGDTYAPIWHMLGVLKDGVADWQPKFKYK